MADKDMDIAARCRAELMSTTQHISPHLRAQLAPRDFKASCKHEGRCECGSTPVNGVQVASGVSGRACNQTCERKETLNQGGCA
eukprot:930660-Alexandrium_andersonii.AAC.1